MNQKIEKSPPTTNSWGEDIFSLVAAQKLGSKELVQSAEHAIERRYRLELRNKFQNDSRVKSALLESAECLLTGGTFESIKDLTRDSIRAGTEEIFDRVLNELLQELDVMNKREPSTYLVSNHDGKVLMPITEKEIYVPPSYVGEDGIKRPAKPILHPSIAAPLTMQAFAEGRKGEAITKAIRVGSPAAVEHLTIGPDAILDRARMLLSTQGVQTQEPIPDGKPETIEIGRERVDEIHQAPNYNFHRSQMYGSILAKKVLDLLPKERTEARVNLRSATLRTGSKEQWYEVTLSWVAA